MVKMLPSPQFKAEILNKVCRIMGGGKTKKKKETHIGTNQLLASSKLCEWKNEWGLENKWK